MIADERADAARALVRSATRVLQLEYRTPSGLRKVNIVDFDEQGDPITEDGDVMHNFPSRGHLYVLFYGDNIPERLLAIMKTWRES